MTFVERDGMFTVEVDNRGCSCWLDVWAVSLRSHASIWAGYEYAVLTNTGKWHRVMIGISPDFSLFGADIRAALEQALFQKV